MSRSGEHFDRPGDPAEDDVEQQRQQLAETVDALSEKLDVVGRAKTGARHEAEMVKQQSRQPLAIGGAAAVVVLLGLMMLRRKRRRRNPKEES